MTTPPRFPGWRIVEGAGGGYIAYRAVPVPARTGLSNVRCGATVPELYERLAQEARREGAGPSRRAARSP
ncbi:hypothetical protein [Nonomuraea sp. NPDC050783]|uniref:hypothetical protein n=1 Tax=Nonomuraea sp. NPDC050783 TaxID=3154634 RepID=UPI003465D425